MNDVFEFLKHGPLLFDGAMSSYKEERTGAQVLEEYMDAGANAIKTDTFSISRQLGRDEQKALEQLEYAIGEALSVCRSDVFLFADIGPAEEEAYPFPVFRKQIDRFLDRKSVV